MIDVLELINANFFLIVAFLSVITVMFIFVLIIAVLRLNKATRQYKAFLKNADGSSLEQILISNSRTLDQIGLKLELIDNRLKPVEKVYEKSIQHVGVVRFNAFKDMGGDLSYAIALLNQKGDGLVLSSIFGRDDARTYAKPIKGGKSVYQLSEEEDRAIQDTLKAERS